MTSLFSFSLLTEFTALLTTLTWRDSIEIALLTFIIYRFAQWLAIDRQKPLIAYFYQYCILIIGSYYLQLTTLTILLTLSAPFALLALYLLHQQTLQKNFITLKKITAPRPAKFYWVEELIRACIHSLHKQKSITCLIEKNDSLIEFLHIPSFFNADITSDLLDMLIDSSKEKDCILAIGKNGTLTTFNPLITISVPEEQLTCESKKLSYQEQQLLFISSKTDAITFSTCLHTHLFTVYKGGIGIEKLTSNQLLLLLKKYLYNPKEKTHEKHSLSSFTQSSLY